jgi:hypothetical protein
LVRLCVRDCELRARSNKRSYALALSGSIEYPYKASGMLSAVPVLLCCAGLVNLEIWGCADAYLELTLTGLAHLAQLTALHKLSLIWCDAAHKADCEARGEEDRGEPHFTQFASEVRVALYCSTAGCTARAYQLGPMLLHTAIAATGFKLTVAMLIAHTL